MDNWVNIFNTSSNIIFSIVISWYLLSKGIPNLQKSFSEDLRQQREDFTRIIQEERKSSDTMLQTMLSITSELNKTMNETIKVLKER